MKNFYYLFFLVLLNACKPFDTPEQPEAVIETSAKSIDQLEIPSGFTFNTTLKTRISLKAQDNNGKILSNIPFDIYIQKESTDSSFLLSGRTNTEGVFETYLELGSDVKYLIANTTYIGLPISQKLEVNSDKINFIIGENNNVNKPRNLKGNIDPKLTTRDVNIVPFTYMGNYDNDGVPRYLVTPGDIVGQDALNFINASLPEHQRLHEIHPEYFTNNISSNISLRERADIWVTFVYEGTGFHNSIGYYTYPTNNPPTSQDDIASLKIIFPDVSIQNNGGMRTGDKVFLGNFNAGTTVAWFIVPNGWDPGKKIVSLNNGHPIHFSNPELNTFTEAQYRQHTIALTDPTRGRVIIGFEDLKRPSGHQDFNDAVIYATVSPFTAVTTSNIAEGTNQEIDTDNDGISDSNDAAPNDSDIAFESHTPAENQTSSLAFEDLFPKKGDYDMNDLVLDYHVKESMNAANKITQIKFSLTLRAMGAGYHNGFAFELPISPDKVASVTGNKIKDTYIQRNANGTEAGQSKTVIIAFDDGYKLMPSTDGGFVNTETEKNAITNYTFDITVKLRSPVDKVELGSAPFNPFLIVNRERGREVHLPGKTPTDLANFNLFKTDDDDTGSGKYYQTKRKLPWAIHLSSSFQYPKERIPINAAYLKFNNWAEGGGTSDTNWYINATGFRNEDKIYK